MTFPDHLDTQTRKERAGPLLLDEVSLPANTNDERSIAY